jgi:hypothetical protein
VRRIPGFEDPEATAVLGRRIARLVELRESGAPPDADLRWVETLPERLRARLSALGVLDATRLARARSIEDLIDTWERALLDRGATARHAAQHAGRARRVLLGSGAKAWSEIDAPKVERYLGQQRILGGRRETPGEPRPSKVAQGWSPGAANGALGAARAFCRWMIQAGLATEDPCALFGPSTPVRTAGLFAGLWRLTSSGR